MNCRHELQAGSFGPVLVSRFWRRDLAVRFADVVCSGPVFRPALPRAAAILKAEKCDQTWVCTINQIPYHSTTEVPSGKHRRTHPGKMFETLSGSALWSLYHTVYAVCCILRLPSCSNRPAPVFDSAERTSVFWTLAHEL